MSNTRDLLDDVLKELAGGNPPLQFYINIQTFLHCKEL